MNLPFPKRQQGIALIIILGFIVLSTGLIVAFFSRTVTDRQLANSSFSQAKADQLALSAANIILGDLKQEILMGSTAMTINNVTTYQPRSPGGTAAATAYMLPTRDATAATLDAIPNYVRRSGSSQFAFQMLDGSRVGTGAGSAGVSSTTASINGRSISGSRWNKHYLIPKADTTNDKTDPVAAFTAIVPYWVTVTDQGPQVLTTPTNTVIGRYAYVIYDEGGLLDANVVGFPTGTSDSQKGYKGSLSYSDLTTALANATPPISFPQLQMDNIVGWRNYASAQASGSFPGNFSFHSATPYYNAVVSNTSGFLNTTGTLWNGFSDQAFLSRQELIAFQSRAGFPSTALQYLTHFTRTLNAPSWRPLTNYTAPYTYLTSGTTAAALNRDVLSVRAMVTGTTTLTHYDDSGNLNNYKVVQGQPLLQRRFSLARIKWLTPSGPLAGYEEAVHACFGLQWNKTAGIWTYTGSLATSIQSSIKTLDQVASENREPNFFELLQAGILQGSLAVDGGGSVNYPSTHQQKLTLQVLRIGACIIDQYDTDSFPTVIEYNAAGGTPYWRATGIENLPLINAFKPVFGFAANAPLPSVPLQSYFVWQLWNPNRLVETPTSVPKVRIHLKGSFLMCNEWADPSKYPPNQGYNGIPASKFAIDASYEFPASVTSGSAYASTGYILPTSDFTSLSTTAPGWSTTPLLGGTSYFAYRMPDFVLNTDPTVHTGTGTHAVPTSYSSTDTWNVVRFFSSYDQNNPVQMSLEFQNSSNQWIAYSFNSGINDPVTSIKGGINWPLLFSFTQSPYPATPAAWATAWQAKLSSSSYVTFSGANRIIYGSTNFTSDPRSIRFNQWQYDANYGAANLSLWPSTQPCGYGAGHSPASSVSSIASDAIYTSGSMLTPNIGAQEIPRLFYDPTLVSPYEGAFYFPAWLARNSSPNKVTTSSTCSGYPDRDGVQRWADSGLYGLTSGTSGGNPFENAADRPVILNRPFQSVAELGYAFRDDPWRTLDFFTSQSADASLLDLFSLADEGAVAAGKINLNSRLATCLQAALGGVIQEPVGKIPLSAADAQSLAQQLVAFTTGTTGPLLDSSQLATAFLSVTGTAGTTATPLIKTTREAVIRGLASVGQTRTWNLLVDIVAQSGRYSPSAIAQRDLTKFTVDGERHYWAHIAIDRFTNEVVDLQLEPVNE